MNAFWPGLTPFGPPMWQAEADTELTLSASPTTAVGQKALALAKGTLNLPPLNYLGLNFALNFSRNAVCLILTW